MDRLGTSISIIMILAVMACAYGLGTIHGRHNARMEWQEITHSMKAKMEREVGKLAEDVREMELLVGVVVERHSMPRKQATCGTSS